MGDERRLTCPYCGASINIIGYLGHVASCPENPANK